MLLYDSISAIEWYECHRAAIQGCLNRLRLDWLRGEEKRLVRLRLGYSEVMAQVVTLMVNRLCNRAKERSLMRWRER